MALQWQPVHVTAAGGMDESVASRVRPPDRIELRNAHWKRTGEAVKRNGFAQMTRDTEGSNDIEGARGLLSTGEELCILGKRRLWAYHDDVGQWLDRGPIAPCTARSKRVFRESTSVDIGDLSVVGGSVLYMATKRYRLAADGYYGIALSVYSTDEQVHVRHDYDGIEETATAADKPHSVRCSHAGTKLLGFFARGTATPGELTRYYEYETATHTETVLNTTLTTDLWINGVYDIRTYDSIAVSGSGNVVAWIDDTAQHINVRRYNSAHALQATGTILTEAPYTRVVLADDPSLDRIYVLTVSLDPEFPTLLLYALVRSTLAAVWGPVTIYTSTATENVDNLGLAAGGSGTRVECTWTVEEDPAGDGVKTRACEDSRDTSGAGAANIFSMFGLATRSRPFFHDNRCYLVCVTSCAAHVHATNDIFDVGGHDLDTSAFEAHVLMELFPNGTNPTTGTKQPILCGVWDVGVAVQVEFRDSLGFIGGGNNVDVSDTGQYRTATNSMVYVLRSPTDGPLVSCDETLFDFTETPLACAANRGTAAIGGAFVSWYDGEYVTELGYVVAPFPYDNITLSTTGGISDPLVEGSTYQWIAIFKSYDRKGNLHRSLPSAPVLRTITPNVPDFDTATLRFKTTHATNRALVQKHGVEVYRADGDSVYKRVSEPKRWIENRAVGHTAIPGNYVTVDFADTGLTQGEMLYTTSGEIEAVCPEGARIVATGIGRLWLGDLVRGDRVQYSKPIAAGTAFEDATAPEFNEGFGYLLESGQRVTGIGELDDKMVCFTEREVYLIAGRGPDDAGAQNDFSGLVLVSNDAGCIDARSVVGFPGGVLFQSKAGLYKIGRGLEIEFVGQSVRDTLELYPLVTSAVLVPKSTQVRFTCTNAAADDGIVLVYDYRINQWARWSVAKSAGVPFVAVGACLHQDVYCLVDSTGTVAREDATTWKDAGTLYVPMRVEMGWLQPAGRMGWNRFRKVTWDGIAKDAHKLTATYFCDFEAVAAEPSTPWTWAQLLAFESIVTRQQPTLHPTRGMAQAFKLRLEDAEDAVTAATTGEGFTFDGITFEIGLKRGLAKAPAVNMR